MEELQKGVFLREVSHGFFLPYLEDGKGIMALWGDSGYLIVEVSLNFGQGFVGVECLLKLLFEIGMLQEATTSCPDDVLGEISSEARDPANTIFERLYDEGDGFRFKKETPVDAFFYGNDLRYGCHTTSS